MNWTTTTHQDGEFVSHNLLTWIEQAKNDETHEAYHPLNVTTTYGSNFGAIMDADADAHWSEVSTQCRALHGQLKEARAS